MCSLPLLNNYVQIVIQILKPIQHIVTSETQIFPCLQWFGERCYLQICCTMLISFLPHPSMAQQPHFRVTWNLDMASISSNVSVIQPGVKLPSPSIYSIITVDIKYAKTWSPPCLPLPQNTSHSKLEVIYSYIQKVF